jgi:hypothetical protein
MYKKGYSIKSKKGESYSLMKSDFAGDRSFTNASFSNKLKRIRNISNDEYPLLLVDLDKEELNSTTLNDKEEFENWFCDEFE